MMCTLGRLTCWEFLEDSFSGCTMTTGFIKAFYAIGKIRKHIVCSRLCIFGKYIYVRQTLLWVWVFVLLKHFGIRANPHIWFLASYYSSPPFMLHIPKWKQTRPVRHATQKNGMCVSELRRPRGSISCDTGILVLLALNTFEETATDFLCAA